MSVISPKGLWVPIPFFALVSRGFPLPTSPSPKCLYPLTWIPFRDLHRTHTVGGNPPLDPTRPAASAPVSHHIGPNPTPVPTDQTSLLFVVLHFAPFDCWPGHRQGLEQEQMLGMAVVAYRVGERYEWAGIYRCPIVAWHVAAHHADRRAPLLPQSAAP